MKTIEQHNLIPTPGGKFASSRSANIATRRGLLAICLGLLLTTQVRAVDENLDVGDWALDTTSRTLPKVVNTAVDIGKFRFTGGTGSLAISVNASGGSWSVAKRYMIPMRANLWGAATTNKWLRVLPAYDTGSYGANNFGLEVSVTGWEMNVRLRVSSTDGVNAATANIVVESTGVSVVSLSSASKVEPPPPLADTFTGSVLTQINGRVGVNTTPSVDAALDINAGDTGGLRLRPRATAGAPTTGAWSKGTLIVDATGSLHLCTADGAPGMWKKVSP
jgi:hypothetical protein